MKSQTDANTLAVVEELPAISSCHLDYKRPAVMTIESNSSNEMVSNYGENDPDYSPSSSCNDIESDEEINDPAEEKIWIIFESDLDKLFLFCYECGNIITSKTKHCKGEACSHLKLHAYVDIQKHGNHNP